MTENNQGLESYEMKIITSIGPLWLDANDFGLTKISFQPLEQAQTNAYTRQAAAELQEYFAGERTKFTVPFVFESGTPFQQKVWQALRTIPYGETRSYLDIAVTVDSPKAVRAIGQANSRNPLPIILPCHRVIGKNGKLVGYLGRSELDGLALKKQLLTLEKLTIKK